MAQCVCTLLALLYMLVRRCVFRWPHHGWLELATLVHVTSSVALLGIQASASSYQVMASGHR